MLIYVYTLMLQIRRSQQLQKMINVTVGNFPKQMSDLYKSDDIGSFPFNKISEIPRAQWNGTFRWHRLDPSHRVFGYWKKRTVLGTTILSNEKGHFGPTDRNYQADQSRPPSKLAPNIPVWSNQNGPYHLMYVTNRNLRNFARVRSFGMIWIRISDRRSLGSW